MMLIDSEIGKIRQVLTYNGVEALAAVDPAERLELLLEDTLDPELVAEEHALFTACIRQVAGGAGVLDLANLLVETAEDEAGRAHLAGLIPGHELPASLAPQELVKVLFTGYLGKKRIAGPIPNAMFTRDLGAVVGNKLFLASSGQLARAREPVLLKAVLQFHPCYRLPATQIVATEPTFSLEGGDVLVLNGHTVVVGESERTLGASITARLEDFRKAGVRQVLVVVMPPARWNMHLDTVITQIDVGDYLVYKPLIDPAPGENGAHVIAYHLKENGDVEVRRYQSLLAAIDQQGLPVNRLIPCGGGSGLGLQANQEQWTDACNSFALAPGLIIVYQQNRRTNEALSQAGYQVVEAEKFAHRTVPLGKTVITLPGNEIGHGRGGPHCLTQPWVRDTIK